MTSCAKCKQPSETRLCQECLNKKKLNNRARRERFLSAGKCPECGGKRDSEQKLCSRCRDRVRKRNSKRYKAHQRDGKCYGCSAPATGKYCQRCKRRSVEWNRERREELHAEGKCIQCYIANDAPEGRLCVSCILKGSARKWLGNAKRADELRLLIEAQNYECPYSGRKLVIGRNAAIDHKRPRSRGGTDTIDNLQWVDDEVNRAKTSMTHEEFIALCRLIACRFPTA